MSYPPYLLSIKFSYHMLSIAMLKLECFNISICSMIHISISSTMLNKWPIGLLEFHNNFFFL